MSKHLCIICLENSETFVSLHQSEDDKSGYEKLLSMITLEVCEVRPFFICIECRGDLHSSVAFLERVIRSNKILLEQYSTQAFNQRQNYCFDQDSTFWKAEIDTDAREPSNTRNISLSQVEHQQSVSKLKACSKCGSKRRCEHRPPIVHTCHLCKKVFNRKYNFTLHVKRHTGQRDWACSKCGAAQVSASAARAHCRPQARRLCPVSGCRRTYTSTHNLTIHLRSHTGERPHVCRECGKCFITRSVLNDHMRTHSGVKPYLCAVCGARFATNKLAAHLRTHAQRTRTNHAAVQDPMKSHEGIHSCPYCTQRYSHKQSLNRHVRKQHMDCSQKINCSASELTSQIDCFT